MNYEDEKYPAECGEQVTQEVGYTERILCEISELQSLAEHVHNKSYKISGVSPVSANGDGAKEQEPQNFCEHTLKDLKRVRRVLQDTIENMSTL